MGQGQVADVGVLLTATNITDVMKKKLNKCIPYAIRSNGGFNRLDSEIAENSGPFNPLLVAIDGLNEGVCTLISLHTQIFTRRLSAHKAL